VRLKAEKMASLI